MSGRLNPPPSARGRKGLSARLNPPPSAPLRKGYKRCQTCKRARPIAKFRSERGRICLDCQKKRARKASRGRRIWEEYGISHAEYEQLLESQGSVCGICHKGRSYNLDIDHDHGQEAALRHLGHEPKDARRASIRGLLCKTCNRRLLPAARDDLTVLHSAMNYLKSDYPFGGTA